jgi:EmrB/QacA subfamily drug resistance transporter
MDEARIHERRWWALAVLCASLLVITLDNTILNVAIPDLIEDLGATTSQMQWIVDGYTLVFAGLLLTFGSLGDRFGRKGALMIGLVIFGVGSLLSAMAGGATELIFTRASMGIGAAFIMPATLSLLTNIFRDPRERGRAIGIWAAVAGASGALGPIIGGFLLEHFSWGSIFFVNVPVILVAVVGAWFLLPSSKDDDAPRLDPIGAILSIVGLVAVLWAIIEAPIKGWGDPLVMGPLVGGVLVIVMFVVWELTCSHPMLDVRFFRNRRFTAANIAVTLTFFAMFGQGFIGTQYLQTVLGFSALEAGVRALPMAIVMVTVAPLAPRLVERIGTKVVVGGGLSIVAVGLGVLSTVPVTDGYPRMLVGIMILGLGMGLVMAPATESIMGSLPPSKAGVGSAMNDTTRQMGGALGVAIIGSIFASVYRPGVTEQFTDAGVPAEGVAAAKESISGALQVAASVPGELGQQLSTIAKTQFVDGMSTALVVAIGAVLVAAFVAFAFLPARAGDPRSGMEGPLDGIASLTFAEAESVIERDAAERAGTLDPAEGGGHGRAEGTLLPASGPPEGATVDDRSLDERQDV